MLQIITNPVFVSVIVMVVLCMLKMNVYVAIIVSGLLCGLMGGLNLVDAVKLFMSGMGGNINSMFSRLFLGMVAVTLTSCGVGDVLAPRIVKTLGKKSWLLMIGMLIVAACCETVVTLGAVFTTILIPPLLPAFNKFNIDRRKVCTIIMCGLQIGYVCIPIGYGNQFMDIVAGEMLNNGVENVSVNTVASANIPIILAMLIAAGLVMFIYRKPRIYKPVPGVTAPAEGETELPEGEMPKWELKHILALVAALSSVVVQIITGSLQIGAMFAVALLLLFRVVKWKEFDDVAIAGMMRFAYVTFVLMAGCGFAMVSKTVGDVPGLVDATVGILGSSKLIGAIIMLLLGLVVTMGIGSSWGTVPIVAVIMVPMGLQMGFSIPAIIMMVSAAAALGDAGSPASDETLLPTAAFNVDGQHDHIWDTCVPSFICVNAPILVVCSIAACFM
ncbi:MAG: sodium:proton antiporter [Clostridium sp.]|nr:sodium:proton antiporter [Clostridium sp.]